MVPGQGDVPRQHVRVRRDAVVHDRARLADRAALARRAQQDAQDARATWRSRAARTPGTRRRSTSRVRGRRRCRCSRCSAASATSSAWVTVMALYRDVLIAGIGLARCSASAPTCSTGAARGSRSPRPTSSSCRRPSGAKPVAYEGVIVAFEEGTYSDSAMATALKLAAHRRSDVRVVVTIEVPTAPRRSTPTLPEAEATAGLVIETARQWAGRRPARARAGREGSAGRGRPPDRRRSRSSSCARTRS